MYQWSVLIQTVLKGFFVCVLGFQLSVRNSSLPQRGMQPNRNEV